ncbi:MAG TPA: alpha/beta hydrolase [Rubrivivax sp.]|nr:alpha/beta hydrolase [Rubrivivax sp.]
MAEASIELRPPSPWLLLMEGSRAPLEYALTLAAMPWLSRVPRGDGHPVIVFPGLGASGRSTQTLRDYLGHLGYAACDWELGRNQPRPDVLEACSERVLEVAAQHGRKVSLVGWSLGGVYARELAKRLEAQTRCVITLGSPFSGDTRATNAARAYELLGGRPARHDPERAARLRRAPNVPTTSIYSKSDGVVAWQCSLNDDAAHTENIEIHASHLGLGVNPLALYAVADRLRQDPARWQRFDAQTLPRGLFRAGAH